MKVLLILLLSTCLLRGAGVGGGSDEVGTSINATNATQLAIVLARAFDPLNAARDATNGLVLAGGLYDPLNAALNATNGLNTVLMAKLATNSMSLQVANYVVLGTDSVVLLSGAHTATLPTAIGIPGKVFTIKCSSVGTNAILTTLSQTIDGATKWTNTAINKFTSIISDGVNWRVIGQN